MDHSNLIGGLAAKLAGRPPVVWSVHHCDHVAGLTKRSTLLTVNACGRLSRLLPTRIVFCAEHGQVLYGERHRFDMARSVNVPNGVDTTRFVPLPAARAEVRRELALGPDDFVVGLVARYDPLKDHATFLKAAALLAGRAPAARFVLCGTEVDENNQALCQQIDALGLRSRCRLLGQRRDVPRLFAAMDVAASSSVSEAFPLMIIEAMACGLPTTVTDVGDSARMVGTAGHIVPPSDPTALAAAWGELLDAGPAARAQLGRAARQQVREHYDLDVVARQYESLYAAVAAERNGAAVAPLGAPLPVGGGR
jgi:glycosyltransferase involved in cell wall biosynthesis